MQSGLTGSNSNLPENTGRAFPTSFSAQSGSSSTVLNQSGSINYKLFFWYLFFSKFINWCFILSCSGNVQGLHNIHGSFNMSNMQGPYASRNSANLGGLPTGVQQAPGSISSGRYSINNLPNALSQV